MTRVTLYAGPSACGVPAALVHSGVVDLRPPARRGDVERLVAEATGSGVLVLCDGVFQAAPAVSHAELCLALDGGWQVWGVSSMGAIRAFEMRGEGMHGFGYVYSQFLRHADFTDDELCLLHLPEPPYLPLTEALVNVRHALQRLGPGLGIEGEAQRTVIAGLRALWFGARTVETLREILLGPAAVAPAAADALLAGLAQEKVKTLDLARLLAKRPWVTAHAARRHRAHS